ncbi:MAG: cation:proton antiporter [Alphaproteobacteria bacterium]
MSTAFDMTGIALVLLMALAAGAAAQRLRQSALIGYVLAGMALGPGGLALIDDYAGAPDLGEFFLILFLFAAGLELSARAGKPVWRSAAAGGGAMLIAGLALVLPLALLLGHSLAAALLIGFVAALPGIGPTLGLAARCDAAADPAARLANISLVTAAIAFPVFAMALIDFGEGDFGFMTIVTGVLAAALAGGAIYRLGKRPRLTLPFADALDSTPAGALAGALMYCLAGAAIAGQFGFPPAWGGLLAGIAVGNSASRATLRAALAPLRGLLGLAAFTFIGLLADLAFIWDNLGSVAALLLAVTALRLTLPAIAMQRLGESWPRAATAAIVALAPGELGAVLAIAALAAGGLSAEGAGLAFAVIALGLLLSPLWLFIARRIHAVADAPIDNAVELYDSTFGADAAKMQGEWRDEAQAAPGLWGFPMDEFSATEEEEEEEARSEDQDAEMETDSGDEPEPTGDPFLRLGAQVRDAARNGDAPPRNGEETDEPGDDGDDGDDGYRPPRPDA